MLSLYVFACNLMWVGQNVYIVVGLSVAYYANKK